MPKALRLHKVYVPLATILGLGFLFILYYVFYVSWQRTYADERAFRLLSVVCEQLQQRLANLKVVMAAAYVSHEPKPYLEQYLKGAASNITSNPAYKLRQSGFAKTGYADPAAHDRKGTLRLKLMDRSAGLSFRVEYRGTGDGGPADLEFCGPTAPASLCADVMFDTDMHARIHNVTEEYFDDLLIATSSGEVIFQKSASTLTISNLNSLFPPKAQKSDEAKAAIPESKDSLAGKTFAEVSQFSNLVTVHLAGTSYNLYIQPGPFAIPNAKGDDKIVVCGLWRADRFRSEVVSIPNSDLIWTALLLPAAFALIWPVLKLAWMSASERLRRRQVLYLLVSSLVVTMLLTLIVLNCSYALRSEEEADEQLKTFADSIDSNVKTELVRALAFMKTINQDQFLYDGLLHSNNPTNWMQPSFLNTYAARFDEIRQRDKTAYYPYFELCFWADGEGRQQFKTTVQGVATPATSIREEAYFRAVMNRQDLPTISDAFFDKNRRSDENRFLDKIPGWEDVKGAQFRFDTVYSRNTGEFFVILAVPYPDPAAPNAPTWKDLPQNAQHLKAQVLVTRLLSLLDPVMPQGFEYAIVNHTGIVQVHSNAARNQIENFFAESRQDHDLRALVAQGAQDFLTAEYMGKQRRLLVRPMPYLGEPAYSLVVIRDTNYFSTINVACILVFTLLGCLFGILLLMVAAIYLYRRRDYPLAPLWPARSAIPKYLNIVVANGCLAVAFSMRFPSMRMNETLMAVLSMAGIAILFACLKTAWASEWQVLPGKVAVLAAIVYVAHGSLAVPAAGLYIAYAAASLPAVSGALHRSSERVIPLRQLYVAAVFSLLAVIVVLPSFGLFKVSYNTINRLALQSAQLARRDQLFHRAEGIRRYFRELAADSLNAPAVSHDGQQPPVRQAPQPPHDAVLKHAEAYAQERLNEILDRYDLPLFNPDPKPLTADDEEDQEDLDIGWLEPLIASATGWFPTNGLGAALREVAKGNHGNLNSTWITKSNGDDQVLWLKDVDAKISSEGSLRGVYPLWQLPWQAALLLMALAVLLAVWIHYLIRKLFVTDLEGLPPLGTWIPSPDQGGNLLILGHPKSGKSRLAAALPNVKVLDLALMATTGSWDPKEFTEASVVVDHFEFDIDNPDICLAKLHLLEHLLYVQKRRVILLSAVDPLFYLVSASPDIAPASGGKPESATRLLDRWSGVLSQFQKLTVDSVTEQDFYWKLKEQRAPWQRDLVRIAMRECSHTAQLYQIGYQMIDAHLKKGPVTSSEFMEELLERADAYYRVLWGTCTKAERLVLYQLAKDGWANPKNEQAIQQLQRRRIIRQESGLRIMNGTFRRFVLTAQLPGEVAQWEESEEYSAWSVLKLALGTAALMFGAWLLYSQRDVFQVGVGYIAALTGASGAILTLFRTLMGRGGGQTANG